MEKETTNYQEEGVTMRQIFSLMKKNWIIILAVTLAFTIVGAIYGLGFKQTTYTASADLMVKGHDDGSSASSEYTFSYYLVNTIKPFITGDSVVENVAESVFKPTSENLEGVKNSLKSNLTVTTSTNSLIITIAYKASDEKTAINVVNAFVASAISVANAKQLDQNGDPILDKDGNYIYTTADGYLANTIFELNAATTATGKRGASLVIIIAFLVGFALSFAAVLIKYLANDTFTSKDDLESSCGVNVLALIEDAGGDE